MPTPHPPIWIAAFGPKALAQAGALGAPYLASPMESRARLKDNYRLHAQACQAAGRALPAEVPVMRTVFASSNVKLVARVRDDLDRWAASRSASAARGAAGSVDDWAIVGEPAAVRDRIAQYRRDLGITHLIVTPLRIGGVDAAHLERSVETVASMFG